MKELSIEQKAQAYDEAISKMKEIITMDNTPTTPREIGEYLFSELKDSEDDRIRNFISNELACLRATEGKGSDRYEELTNAIAWLEKKGEQKVSVVDFKAEDWYVSKVDGKIYNTKFMEQNSCKKTTRREEIEKAAFSTSGIIEQTDWFIKGAEWADEHPCCNWLEKQSCQKSIDELTPQEAMDVAKCFKKSEQNLTNEMKSAEESLGISSKEYNDIVDECLYGEPKSADKVEPKFKVGDWITDGNITIQIKAIENDCYLYCGDCVLYSTKTADKVYHIWTIKDVKDGDILAVEPENGYPSPFIAICKERGLDFFNSHCFVAFDGKFYVGENGHSIEDIHPATKEQRDTLEKAMTDAGYTFDFKKKELKKIEWKSTWSEDDSYMLGQAIKCVNNSGKLDVSTEEIEDWLKSLKDHVQSKPEWSEEDEGFLNLLLAVFTNEHPNGIFSTGDIPVFKGNLVTSNRIIEWLKSLRPQPKQEWGEEDERLFQIVIDILDRQNHLGNISRTDLIACVKKLKSLRPQSTWKPSDEQMKALNDLNLTGGISYVGQGQELINLYNDLKNLREE